ncbi:hypothetical protein RKE38_14400 [Phycicoccus sp. M110.8]|uniref:hypothetical protein n=1 Tax=Phycicoccus sp. M110.8 TaxID=3075433 RepID=UPI0028FD7067|nr:hypothetical protein [Phycicoccus sp. M110.8]MDU0314887.1 hypothetical protein [Phycicoccus sp. M110.8]
MPMSSGGRPTVTWYVGPWAERDRGPAPVEVTGSDPSSLTFLNPRGSLPGLIVGGVAFVAAFALLVDRQFAAFMVLGLMALVFGLLGLDRLLRSRRPAVVVGPRGVWFGPERSSTAAHVVAWADVSEFVLFTAVHDGPKVDNHSSVRSGIALGARRLAPPALPPEVQQDWEQLMRFVGQAPHTAAALQANLQQAALLPHRYVRTSALGRREELATAVQRWAPHVRVTLGDRVDFRVRHPMLPVARDAIDGIRDSLRRPAD